MLKILTLKICSYFEKGCRMNCSGQPRKVLWVVLSSLFFKEIWKNGTGGEATDICLRVLKESNKSSFDSYSIRNSVLIISHITFQDCRVRISSDNLSRNSCMWPDRMLNTWQPKKSRLQNEILTASIAQEIEEEGNINRRQKGSGKRQWRNKGKGERVRRE